jgi:two-component system, NtrC family, nitrogen regulation sensor histidine kinase NtrY
MKQLKILLILIILSILAASAGVFFHKQSSISEKDNLNVELIEKQISNSVIKLQTHISEISKLDSKQEIAAYLKKNQYEFTENSHSIFIYEDEELVLWSDRNCPLDSIPRFTTPILTQRMSNGWYIFAKETIDTYDIIGAIQIKQSYHYQNPHLPRFYNTQFSIPDYYYISNIPNQKTDINYKGDFQFNLSLNEENITNTTKTKLSNIFGSICFILIMCSLFIAYFHLSKLIIRYKILLFFAFIFDLALLRWIMFHFQIPRTWYELELFSPKLFAESHLVNSLGCLLINSIFLLCFALLFHRGFSFQIKKLNHSIIDKILGISFSLLSFALLIFATFRLNSLIENSSIPFTFNRILSLNPYSFLGLGIGFLYFLSILIIIDKLIIIIRNNISFKQLTVIFIFIGILLALIFRILPNLEFETHLLTWTMIISIVIIIIRINYLASKPGYYYGLIGIVLVSFLFTTHMNHSIDSKHWLQQKVTSMNLSNERDAGAEYYLQKLNIELIKDKKLTDYFTTNQIEKAIEYFSNKYMSGYLSKYDFQISMCSKTDSIIIEPDNLTTPCHEFFFDMQKNKGILLPGSDFYFLDNNNGRISYLGIIPISENDSMQNTIFLELNQQVQIIGPGYPELLLDKSLLQSNKDDIFSSAKYHQSEIVTSTGKFQYPTNYNFPYANDEYTKHITKKYKHLIYQPDSENIIIVSRPAMSSQDYLIFFTYIFFILFIIYNLFWLIRFFINRQRGKTFTLTMKNRIQVYFVTILSLSIIIIGIISILFYIQRYQEKQEETIHEKMLSIQIELNHKLGSENQLDATMTDYMNYLLVKFSNVFYTDINLFDLNGKLMASSRQEVYDQGLVGKRMDPDAFFRLSEGQNAIFVQKESIGNMQYLSAYVPFRNNNNEVLAYINLPYFAKQNQFSEEIASLTVAVLNVYLILFLVTIIIAIITSNQLTKPLRMIQESIRNMDIKRRNEKINYLADDELGSLIKEYNRKIDELQESAQRLAQSERESAWREMAKQIAHEIKNPLTPMKLSVQHLEKAFQDNDPDVGFMLQKVSKTLIEQIDSLSHIATEFSNFAKIRVSNKENVDLIERINSSKQLFEGLSHTKIFLEHKTLDKAIVKADNEQVLRLFNNLIKNAVQSIPKNKNGIITISLRQESNKYIVEIEDNGKGIPEDVRNRIFSPNFTTKTSGMGLGLSIVKGITENLNGQIRFETVTGKGTRFIIEFPLKQ